MKSQVNVRMSSATRAKLDALTTRYGTQAEAIAVAVDRLYQTERSTMTRMSYEAEPELIDETVLELARSVHSEVCGCDDKRCSVTNEIYAWLVEGDRGESSTVEQVIAEWREYDQEEESDEE